MCGIITYIFGKEVFRQCSPGLRLVRVGEVSAPQWRGETLGVCVVLNGVVIVEGKYHHSPGTGRCTSGRCQHSKVVWDWTKQRKLLGATENFGRISCSDFAVTNKHKVARSSEYFYGLCVLCVWVGHLHVCFYLWRDGERERERERDTERQRERERERERERQTERQRERETESWREAGRQVGRQSQRQREGERDRERERERKREREREREKCECAWKRESPSLHSL